MHHPLLFFFPSGYFAGTPADYVFMLLFNAVCVVVIGIFLSLPVLSSALIFSVLYVWCQINKDMIVTFWFGIQVKVYNSSYLLHFLSVLPPSIPQGYVFPLGSVSLLLHPWSRVSPPYAISSPSMFPSLPHSWVSMLMGIVVGHLYFFLTMKYPQEYGGRQFLSTPQILYVNERTNLQHSV